MAFDWLAEGRHWVAHADLNDHTLTLRARDLPLETVELIRVTDLDPYVERQHDLERRWARQRFASR